MLLPTFQHMIDSFKIGEFVNDKNNYVDTADESKSITNTNNNQYAIKNIRK